MAADDLKARDADFAYYLTLSELFDCMDYHIDAARDAESDGLMGVHLRMASRALRCALEIHLAHLEEAEAHG